ncbi:MAG: hypothetical protein K2X03_19375 [Bryobacteraceae bacterium]|nr:hypothetical protein [Bryobacteraceae bacterium]
MDGQFTALEKRLALALQWRLWGVLFSGTLNALLFEHGGEAFRGHLIALVACLIVLPVIGGMLTPEKPAYTVVVFAVGSVPPWTDIPPIPIGLWPFLFAEGSRPVSWLILPAITALAVTTMAVIYLPLVYSGWRIRSWKANHAI